MRGRPALHDVSFQSYKHQKNHQNMFLADFSRFFDKLWVNPWGFYHFQGKKFFFDFAALVRRIIVENGLGYLLKIFA
jgi:hypothetical protein